nr:putative 1-phosphatidylinositol-3-phosphate 5-kinase FAB1C [Tanacetum cinerariifolium]
VTCYFAKKFDDLRKKCCPNEVDYMRSLPRCKGWSAQGGKSNAYLAKSLDDRFIVKGVIVKHLRSGKETKMHLMVMENLFFKKSISWVYDLKGSARSRYNSDMTGTNKTLLHMNLLEALRTNPISVGGKAKRNLERAVWNDTSFLAVRKRFSVRAKETTGWIPDFDEQEEDNSESEDEQSIGFIKEDFDGSDVEKEEDNNVSMVPDLVKEDVNVQAEEKGNDFDVNNSLDPFELYPLLNKKKNMEEKMDKSNGTVSIPFPPRFNPCDETKVECDKKSMGNNEGSGFGNEKGESVSIGSRKTNKIDIQRTGGSLLTVVATKQKVREEYSPMLYQTLGLALELEQPLLLGRREGIPDCHGLADECPQGRDSGCGHILPRGRMGTGYASYPHSKTTGDAAVFDMDLFNLIRAPNPTKVKVGSRPRAPHEVPLLTLTAPRIIEMDEPAATDSPGVLSTIERSPLDFGHEVGASDQGSAASKIPSSEDVPAIVASGVGQAEETATMDPPTAPESHKRGHDGTYVNAPQSLAFTVVPEVAPVGVSDLDPLSFADALSRHLADVAQSSQGIAAAGDPGSENASSPAEVGSSRSVYRPEWGITNGSPLDTPEACHDLVDHAAPSGYYGSSGPKNPSPGAGNKKSGTTTGDRGRNKEGRERQELLLSRSSREEKLNAAFKEFKRYEDERVEQRRTELDARLDALSIDFDEELYPHMLTAIAGCRWVIGHGLRLAMMKCAESLEMRQAFADVLSARVAKEAKFVATLQSLKDLKYPLLDQLEGLKDAPMDVIMAALYLKSDTRGMPHNIYATSAPTPLSLLSPCIRRSDGISVFVPTVVPRVLPFCWWTRPRKLVFKMFDNFVMY